MTRLTTAIATGLITAVLLFPNAERRTPNDERTPHYPSPVDVKLSPDGKLLYVVCQGTDELVVIDTATNRITKRVAVGHMPRGIAVRDRRVWVTNSWSDTVTEISGDATRILRAGFEPSGVIADATATNLYVANRIGSDISVIDLANGNDAKRLVAGRGASYITSSSDGSHAFATHIYPNIGKHRATPESEITVIDTAHQIVERRLALHNVGGVFQIADSSDGRLGIATELRPKNLIPLAHVEHGWAFGDAIAVFGDDIGESVVQLPLDELERYFSLPFGVAIASDKSRVYLSASGSDEVAILDGKRLIAAARSPRAADLANDLSASAAYVVARIAVGRNPRGLALSPGGTTIPSPSSTQLQPR